MVVCVDGGSLDVAIFHLSTKPISRSAGRSAVAAAAYRTQSLLVDERQGLTHDYERRSGVEYTELVLPEEADRAYWTRQQLWNAAEFAEVRKDARTAREWELALPDELSPEGRQKLAVGFAGELASRYGCAVDVAIHAPGREGDHRNHHAHLLATTRVVAGSSLGEKVAIELSDAKRLSLGLGQGRQEIEQVRSLWAERTNQALEKQGIEQKIDHRSLEAQREEALTAGDIIRAAALDRMPETKLGWKASAMERRGIETERGQQLREVKQENTLRQVLMHQIEKLRELAQRVEQAVKSGIGEFRQKLAMWREGARPNQPQSREGPEQVPKPPGESGLQPEREDGRAAFRRGLEQWKDEKAEAAKKQEQDREREQSQILRDRGRGFER
jgi:hypothetical protein